MKTTLDLIAGEAGVGADFFSLHAMNVVKREASAVLGVEGRVAQDFLPGMAGGEFLVLLDLELVAPFARRPAPIVDSEVLDCCCQPSGGPGRINAFSVLIHLEESLAGEIFRYVPATGISNGEAQDFGGVPLIDCRKISVRKSGTF